MRAPLPHIFRQTGRLVFAPMNGKTRAEWVALAERLLVAGGQRKFDEVLSAVREATEAQEDIARNSRRFIQGVRRTRKATSRRPSQV